MAFTSLSNTDPHFSQSPPKADHLAICGRPSTPSPNPFKSIDEALAFARAEVTHTSQPALVGKVLTQLSDPSWGEAWEPYAPLQPGAAIIPDLGLPPGLKTSIAVTQTFQLPDRLYQRIKAVRDRIPPAPQKWQGTGWIWNGYTKEIDSAQNAWIKREIAAARPAFLSTRGDDRPRREAYFKARADHKDALEQLALAEGGSPVVLASLMNRGNLSSPAGRSPPGA